MKKSTQNHVRDTLRANRLNTKKRFGQNYLLDDNILRRIIETADIEPGTPVIEIGPGLGSLTRYLLKASDKVLAYEIDTDLTEVLSEMFEGEKGFELETKDFLKAHLDDDIKSVFGPVNDVIVVANLPYYITTPVIMKCLENTTRLKRLVFMMQNEVAQRLSARPNTKAYNALSVMIQYKTKTKYAFKVPRTVFMPSPDVDSAVVTMDIIPRDKRPAENEDAFIDFVKRAFKQKRKTLVNNLHVAYDLPKEDLKAFLSYHGYKESVRAEGLTVEDFLYLSERIRQEFF
ncbi:MAG: 16S rRNA (adenine(1518)-N(6)/adenine(1519)-N(6))-dimethyltransferase RsmA [Candidatus Izemoplasmataceae bacterium]